LQWQWQANPQPNWVLPSPAIGSLRLFAVAPPVPLHNYWEVPNLLLQKFPAPEFSATTKGRWIGAKVGIFAIGSRAANEMGYADFDGFGLSNC
jgi:hypothetical protein